MSDVGRPSRRRSGSCVWTTGSAPAMTGPAGTVIVSDGTKPERAYSVLRYLSKYFLTCAGDELVRNNPTGPIRRCRANRECLEIQTKESKCWRNLSNLVKVFVQFRLDGRPEGHGHDAILAEEKPGKTTVNREQRQKDKTHRLVAHSVRTSFNKLFRMFSTEKAQTYLYSSSASRI